VSLGDEGSLTLTVKVGVRAEPKEFGVLMSLMYRYREALNYAIRVVVENEALRLVKHTDCYMIPSRSSMVYHLRWLLTATERR
jgi:hypothetical protein